MRVEVAVFSGRPDPSWELASSAARRLVTALRQLARDAVVPELPEGLGYRGFVITLEPGELEPWRQLVVYRDTVVARDHHEAVAFRDPQRVVETTLLEIAKAHDPALVMFIERAMATPEPTPDSSP